MMAFWWELAQTVIPIAALILAIYIFIRSIS